jgi:hypothetical protein
MRATIRHLPEERFGGYLRCRALGPVWVITVESEQRLADAFSGADGRAGGGPAWAGEPTEIGPYRVIGRLGSGGMGTVYLARGPAGARVAVKVIRPELAGDVAFLDRFRREVRAARRVAGFCTARVLDADLDGPVPYLVTEYVDGVRLDRVVATGGPLAATPPPASPGREWWWGRRPGWPPSSSPGRR